VGPLIVDDSEEMVGEVGASGVVVVVVDVDEVS
jgi:hypothetical protein